MSFPNRSHATAAALVTLLVGGAAPAFASPGFVTPSYTGSTPAGCQTCHVNSGGGTGCTPSLSRPCLNQFGSVYRASGWVSSVRNGDADGDGDSNSSQMGSSFSWPGYPDNIWSPLGGDCNPASCGTSCGT